MSERLIGARRARDMAFLDFAQRVVKAVARDREDTEWAALLMLLLEEMRRAVALRACTIEDLAAALRDCEQGGSVLDPLPNERTPAERPAEKKARDPLWRRLIRGHFGR